MIVVSLYVTFMLLMIYILWRNEQVYKWRTRVLDWEYKHGDSILPDYPLLAKVHRSIGGGFFPVYNALPSYNQMLCMLWKPVKSFIPKIVVDAYDPR